MNFGKLSVRATKEATAGGPWVQPYIVQVLFQPTYLGTLTGLPTKDGMLKGLTNTAERLWGKRESLQILTGSGKHRYPDLTPEAIAEFEAKKIGYRKFPSTAVFVELAGPVLDPRDHYDIDSTAWLVMLGGGDLFGGGVNRAVQRLIDGYEIAWAEVAINTAP